MKRGGIASGERQKSISWTAGPSAGITGIVACAAGFTDMPVALSRHRLQAFHNRLLHYDALLASDLPFADRARRGCESPTHRLPGEIPDFRQ